jgi:hypothetical protein
MIELWFIDFSNKFDTYHMSSREGMFHEWCVKHFQWLFRVLCNTCILNWLLFLLKKKLVTLPLLKWHMFPYLLCFLKEKKKVIVFSIYFKQTPFMFSKHHFPFFFFFHLFYYSLCLSNPFHTSNLISLLVHLVGSLHLSP